jgi:ferrous iron transport protein B
MKSFALAGNPNCGKTTLFNSLTGSSAYVGNWPGVTVEKRSGTYFFRKGDHKGEEMSIVDLPGIYSLSPYSPEEVISRNYLLNGHPDCVINVIDGTNLERNLYMTTQILEMDVPVVIAINMIDAVKKDGNRIDCDLLEKVLGVPVVEVSALKKQGLDVLMEAARKVSESPRKGRTILPFKEILGKAQAIYENLGVSSPLFHAVKALEKDELEQSENKEAGQQVLPLLPSEGPDYEAEIANQRYLFIAHNCAQALIGRPVEEKEKLSLSDKIDKVLTNRWAGIPIFLVLLFVIFHFVFGEDLLYLHHMGIQFGTFNEGGPFEGLFYSQNGITSVGVFSQTLIQSITDNLINPSIKTAMENAGAHSWASGFVVDGVLSGIAAVLSFLPQIMWLFLFFSILEDSGYMARVAFILDRIFRRFGLSGRAFLPMIMGLGCGVPAMINTRTLNTEKERTQTIRVIPFFPCSAKLTVITAIAGGVAASAGMDASLITFFMYVFGMTSAIALVLLMHHTTQREAIPPFIMELPSYHLPQPQALAVHLWDKLKHFVTKAFTIIALSTMAVWLFSHINWSWQFLEDYTKTVSLTLEDGTVVTGEATFSRINESILADIGRFIMPIFTPLGFGSQLNSNGWVFSVATIAGTIAKESVVGTFGTLAASFNMFSAELQADGTYAIVALDGADAVTAMLSVNASTGLSLTGITNAGLIAFMAFNCLNIPCFASVATAKAELGKGQIKYTIAFWCLVSYVEGALAYLTFRWPWTLGLTLPGIVLLFVGAYAYDYKQKQKEIILKDRENEILSGAIRS